MRSEIASARGAVREAMAAISPAQPEVALATGKRRAVAKLVGLSFDSDDIEDAIALLVRAGVGEGRPGRGRSIRCERHRCWEGRCCWPRPPACSTDPSCSPGGGVQEGAALDLASGSVSAAA